MRLKSEDSSHLIGIMLAEEAYTFALTFKAYNNITNNTADILADRVLEANFGSNRVIFIEFMTPVFLS